MPECTIMGVAGEVWPPPASHSGGWPRRGPESREGRPPLGRPSSTQRGCLERHCNQGSRTIPMPRGGTMEKGYVVLSPAASLRIDSAKNLGAVVAPRSRLGAGRSHPSFFVVALLRTTDLSKDPPKQSNCAVRAGPPGAWPPKLALHCRIDQIFPMRRRTAHARITPSG